MKQIIFFLIFSFTPFNSHAKSKAIEDLETNSSIIDMKGSPSAIVGGHVNAITGNYREGGLDLYTPGSNPIRLSSSYSSAHKEKGTLSYGWDLNLFGDVCRHQDEEDNYWVTSSVGGSNYHYVGGKNDTYKLDEQILNYGVTNCANGKLTARSKLINTKVSFDDKLAEMTHGGNERFEFYSKKWDCYEERVYRLMKHFQGNLCHFTYDYSKKFDLQKVTSKGKGGDTLGFINLNNENRLKKDPKFTVSTDDGRSVTYVLEYPKKSASKRCSRVYVKDIVSSNFPTKSFEYKYIDTKTCLRMTKSSLPEERFTNIKYFENKSLRGRVSTLLSPIGTDTTPITTYKFSYKLNSKSVDGKLVGGETTVTDALGYKTGYLYSRRHRLRTINQYDAENSLYRSENITWGSKGTSDYTLLKRRSLDDGNGNPLLVRSYEYSKEGNAIREHLEGNLRGVGEWDKHTTSYTYASKGLVASENDGRKTIAYVYHANSDLLYKKFVKDGNVIKERHFFAYNLNGAQTLEIVDDGNSEDMNSLSGVTERKIKRIESTPKGLPKVIQESYLDLSRNLEISLTKSVNSYSTEGYLTRKEIFNNSNTESMIYSFEYDSMGNLLSETNPMGDTTQYSYDKNGNCLLKQTPNASYYSIYAYDFCNRLIHEEEVYTDGKRLAKSYSYDLKGNRVSTTDIYGNITRHEYDAFNRLIRTITPDQDTETTTYDELNNPIQRCDKNGYVTTVGYTGYGKPYSLRYPNGSEERCRYSLDGTMEEVISTSGAITQFKHDYKNRKTEEIKLSPQGEILSKQIWKYNAFHLIESIDPKGIVTNYFYDGAGRLARKISGEMEVRYAYDAFGRESESWELYAPSCYRKTIRSFNKLNQIIEERIEDSFGTVFSIKTFGYDIDGNQTSQSILTSDGVVTKSTQFNPHKQPVRIIHPNGEETLFIYDYSLNTGYEEEIDPKGSVTARTRDVNGRVALEEIHSPTGELLKKISYIYDGMGHCVARYEDLIINNVIQKTTTTNFEYDSRGWETAVIEAVGKPEQKITRRDFTPLGEIAHLYKPDGTILTHSYDLLGRLIEVSDNVNSIHQHYIYDLNDNILSVTDSIANKTTKRTFDSQDRLIKEELQNGLEIAYEHDPMGRIVKVILPDSSSIEYQFNAHQIETITRGDYSYHYKYNQSGHLAKISLPNGNGEITYAYDNALRPIKVSSLYTSQTVPEDGYDPCSNLLQIDLSDSLGEVSSTYEYDALHQVISEEGVATHEYAYDSKHNRIQKDEAIYENNDLNQLLSQSDTAYTYDPNGNRTTQTSQRENIQCEYDSLDRLISVTKDTIKAAYQYDPFHRRTAKTVYTLENGSWIESGHEIYLYQGEQEIGTLDQLRILGPGISNDIGATVAMELHHRTYLPIHDHRGNVISLIHAESKLVMETIHYSAYGEEQIYDALGNQTASPITPWRFSSKRVDPETGWSFFGRRYYDTEVGRWTTPDPLWFEDGPNLYCYVHNRPLRFVDPNGLSFFDMMPDFPQLPHRTFNGYDQLAERINFSVASLGGIVQFRESRETDYTIDGKKSSKIAITFINGICNTIDDAMASARIISNMAGGCRVQGIYNQTHGIALDLYECSIGLGNVCTDPVQRLHALWDECFEKLDDDGMILHGCHSQGAIHTRNALETYDKEKRKRIQVLAFAPAAYISQDICGKVEHILSERDFVPLINQSGKGSNQHTTTVLQPHPDAAFWDHSFDSPTYRAHMFEEINSTITNQGFY